MDLASRSLHLIKKILAIDSESQWTDLDVDAPRGEQDVFKRYLNEVLTVVDSTICGIVHSYVAVSGLKCRHFLPIAAIRRDESKIKPSAISLQYGKSAINVALAEFPERNIILIDEARLLQDSKGDPTIKKKLVIKLDQYGEFFGFISLDTDDPNTFGEEDLALLAEVQPVLSRTIADSIFSMRLRKLSSPFHFASNRMEAIALYNEIAEQAALGFAADGSVLRVFDETTNKLEVAAYFPEDDGVCPDPVSVREQICRAVFESPTESFAARNVAIKKGFGVEITWEQENELIQIGIHSYMIMVLKSELQFRDRITPKLGTLAIFHSRDHEFSWRDIALFKGFCQRVTDLLLLKDSNDRLEEQIDLMRAQSAALTSVELVGLIAHDLFHKAFANERNVIGYIDKARASLNNRSAPRSHEHLEVSANGALQSARALGATLEQLRLVQSRGTDDFEEAESFDLRNMVVGIESTLVGAMNRAKMKMNINISSGIIINARKSVLLAALYNLVINSIEAARTRTSLKTGMVHIQAHVEPTAGSKKIILTVWDDGPGINRARFKDPSEIFKIGITTKKQGTGTGLPAARQLLNTHLNAQLVLVNPEKALFRITIPQ